MAESAAGFLTGDDTTVFVAECDDTVVGYAAAQFKENGARIIQVWTQIADEGACRLYEKLGLREYTRMVFYSMDTANYAE